LSLEELERRFIYSDKNVDVKSVRTTIGLDFNGSGQINPNLPIEEKVRQYSLLKRLGALRDGDLEAFRSSTKHEENPWQIKNCPEHGAWYHDVFGCMHHEHTDGLHSDLPPMDKAPRD